MPTLIYVDNTLGALFIGVVLSSVPPTMIWQGIPAFGKFFTPWQNGVYSLKGPPILSRVYSRGEIPAILELDASEGGNRKDECWWRRTENTERLDPHHLRGLLVTAPRGEKGLVYGRHEETLALSGPDTTIAVTRQAADQIYQIRVWVRRDPTRFPTEND
ncbi:hypothetical protein EDB83DRAFT_2312473 [Lactarius deliciosus]|nr:hypothetical protein EDB83DRAFT_2312473 [Lactarius deliciosus]